MVVCHTDVVRPTCSGMQTADSTGPLPEAKKLVFDSMVPPRYPGGRFAVAPNAPSASANDMMAPPFTRPLALRCIGVIGISAVTFFGDSDVTRMPSAFGIPPFKTGFVPTDRFCGSAAACLTARLELFFFVAMSLPECARFSADKLPPHTGASCDGC